jgi:hypothetical protein
MSRQVVPSSVQKRKQSRAVVDFISINRSKEDLKTILAAAFLANGTFTPSSWLVRDRKAVLSVGQEEHCVPYTYYAIAVDFNGKGTKNNKLKEFSKFFTATLCPLQMLHPHSGFILCSHVCCLCHFLIQLFNDKQKKMCLLGHSWPTTFPTSFFPNRV